MAHRAILIGSSEYPNDPHNLPPLVGPPADVAALEAVLTDPTLGLHAKEDVVVVRERTKLETLVAIESFFRASSPDDHVFFYFSGHARLDDSDDLHLCVADTTVDALVATGISSNSIGQIVKNSRVQKVVVVLDCCYAGAFTFKSGDVPAHLKGKGRYVLACCQRREKALDPSPFTQHLVDGLRTGDADVNRDGYVSVNDLAEYVTRQLRTAAQRPVRHCDQAFGDVPIGRARAGELTPFRMPAVAPTARRGLRRSAIAIAVPFVIGLAVAFALVRGLAAFGPFGRGASAVPSDAPSISPSVVVPPPAEAGVAPLPSLVPTARIRHSGATFPFGPPQVP